jgi:hypothetical protein
MKQVRIARLNESYPKVCRAANQLHQLKWFNAAQHRGVNVRRSHITSISMSV